MTILVPMSRQTLPLQPSGAETPIPAGGGIGDVETIIDRERVEKLLLTVLRHDKCFCSTRALEEKDTCMTMQRWIKTASLTICLIVPLAVGAEERIRDYEIPLGMSQADVLRRAGPPKEKSENEAARREVWVYGVGKEVTFLNGVVIGRRFDSNSPPSAPAPIFAPARSRARGPAIQEPQGIFAEIMREADAEAEAGPKP